ncbi:hypothetical protein J2X20_003947 [Pelomonas saccharophila]|uniref:DUF2946 domain-containing protein n=1 Tax=Roseateles saccharophilus TaxID=304 RepID=A0ABU1YQY8_ROSSA|nr:hypothetical protein [Roseateles saccharophilus]MDR7271279.1 hypothetical protein [Roseateles saccharophilus]
MRRPGRFFVLCLLLVLLPVRSLLAAVQLECGPAQAAPVATAHAGHEHHGQQTNDHHADAAGKACKLCAPCCLAAAPPPALMMTVTAAPAERAALVPAERWTGVVPPLPDPPPRA